MTAPTPYLHLPGTARDALVSYVDVFGGEVELHTFASFGRSDGPPDAIAHGALTGPVTLFAADTGAGEPVLRAKGLVLALLGVAEPDVMRSWFDVLAREGTVVDPLQRRPWGDHDGRLVDAFGVPWLLGFSGQNAPG